MSELSHLDPGLSEEFEPFARAVELVVEDLGDAALLDEKRAVDAGAVRDEDRGALGGIAVLRQLRDGVQLRVLHFGARDQLPVHFHLAAVVVARRHPVPAERDDRVVLHDDAAHLEACGIAALRGDVRDAHVHFVVFLNVHDGCLGGFGSAVLIRRDAAREKHVGSEEV